MALALTVIVLRINPDLAPFGITKMWTCRGDVGDWLTVTAPMLLWGWGLSVLIGLIADLPKSRKRPEELLAKGLVVSTIAGVIEEVLFRWIWFMFLMLFVQLADFILGGFIFGHGLPWLIYEYLLGPLANLVTFHQLDGFLNHPSGWHVGSGLLAANARFRDGHKYQGPLGVVNSWFMGMYLFYIALNYGLVAAILAHFLYDLGIDCVRYAGQKIAMRR